MKKLYKYLILIILVILPNTIFAACPSGQIETVFGSCINPNPPKGSTNVLVAFIKSAFTWLSGIIGSLAILGLIWAAFMYITSAGNPDSIAKAKDIIITSITSLVIIIFSYAFFKLLGVV